MLQSHGLTNLVLGGGGIRGIAYIGMLEAARAKGFVFRNIAGVSAGALVGALTGAGYGPWELKKVLGESKLDGINMKDASRRMPIVRQFLEYCTNSRYVGVESFKEFLGVSSSSMRHYKNANSDVLKEQRNNIFKNIITYSKEGSLFNGDYLEEWVYKILLKKGIKTFADLRTETSDKLNPKGYKVRMTAVDVSRGKVIILPDDIAFYGIEPGHLEVAKAIRMSTSVPFAFKPVQINKEYNGITKTFYLVDGGILDNLPSWLISPSQTTPLVAGVLRGRAKFSVMTPLNILKTLISVVHDFGIPDTKQYENCSIVKINTGSISFLDFGLTDREREYLIQSGKRAAYHAFGRFRM